MSDESAGILARLSAAELALMLQADPNFRLPAWVPERAETTRRAVELIEDCGGDGGVCWERMSERERHLLRKERRR